MGGGGGGGRGRGRCWALRGPPTLTNRRTATTMPSSTATATSCTGVGCGVGGGVGGEGPGPGSPHACVREEQGDPLPPPIQMRACMRARQPAASRMHARPPAAPAPNWPPYIIGFPKNHKNTLTLIITGCNHLQHGEAEGDEEELRVLLAPRGQLQEVVPLALRTRQRNTRRRFIPLQW